MKRYRVICPDCSAVLIAATKHSMLFELCPSCKHHVWDQIDALLADPYSMETQRVVGPVVRA